MPVNFGQYFVCKIFGKCAGFNHFFVSVKTRKWYQMYIVMYLYNYTF